MKCWTRIAAVSLVIICCTFAGGISLAAVDIQELDDLLTQVETYDYGQSRENLTKITDMIRKYKKGPNVKVKNTENIGLHGGKRKVTPRQVSDALATNKAISLEEARKTKIFY